MVARDVRNHFDFVRRQAVQVAVLDEVIGVLVMLPGIDEIAHIVQDRRVFEPLALALA